MHPRQNPGYAYILGPSKMSETVPGPQRYEFLSDCCSAVSHDSYNEELEASPALCCVVCIMDVIFSSILKYYRMLIHVLFYFIVLCVCI